MLLRARHWLAHRSRRTKRLILVLIDFLGLVVIIWLAFSFRFGRAFVPNAEQTALILAGPLIAIPIFIRLGLYRAVLRYLPGRAVWTVIKAVSLSTLIWVTLAFLTKTTGAAGIPRTIPVLYWIGSVVGVAGTRFGIKWMLRWGRKVVQRKRRILIFGVGDAGVQLANALRSASDRQVVAFVSEDTGLRGMDVMGIRVHPMSQIEDVISNFDIDEIIITTSSSTEETRRELVARLGGLPVKIRVLPALTDLAAGKYLVSYVRDIDIDDLLGRSPVPSDPALISASVEGRSIMVTGAAGSIGSALCRLIARSKPARLVLFEVNEHGLYQIERDLKAFCDAQVVPVLGSVTDQALLSRTIGQHGVQVIFHCAAYKHVGLVESNRVEGVKNNVLGTQAAVEAALAADVETFILISTDKAVRPTSVMGASKRWAELIVRAASLDASSFNKRTKFASVRFGNVIGSSGSVIPLFKEQIAAGGPITVTHDDMTRYFMSIREAAELIVQGSTLAESGDTLLLDMGAPVRIRDLAANMVMLAGHTVRDEENPDGSIEIVNIGVRDGEKLVEELFYDPSGVIPSAHPKILRARRRASAKSRGIQTRVQTLRLHIESGNETAVSHTLFDMLRDDIDDAAAEASTTSGHDADVIELGGASVRTEAAGR